MYGVFVIRTALRGLEFLDRALAKAIKNVDAAAQRELERVRKREDALEQFRHRASVKVNRLTAEANQAEVLRRRLGK